MWVARLCLQFAWLDLDQNPIEDPFVMTKHSICLFANKHAVITNQIMHDMKFILLETDLQNVFACLVLPIRSSNGVRIYVIIVHNGYICDGREKTALPLC